MYLFERFIFSNQIYKIKIQSVLSPDVIWLYVHVLPILTICLLVKIQFIHI